MFRPGLSSPGVAIGSPCARTDITRADSQPPAQQPAESRSVRITYPIGNFLKGQLRRFEHFHGSFDAQLLEKLNGGHASRGDYPAGKRSLREARSHGQVADRDLIA
jgi:hypothetical protein